MKFNGKIVFSSGASLNFDIWSIDLELKIIRQLTRGDNINSSPRFSPDGKRIAFISTHDDCIPSLWLMDENGDNKRQLTHHTFCQAPSWSPDGSQIICTSTHTGNFSELAVYSYNLNTDTFGQLFSHQGNESDPSWSPDGKAVLFSAPALNQSKSTRDTDIFEWNCLTGLSTAIGGHLARDYAPMYSPKGDKIAFISHRGEYSHQEYHEQVELYKEEIINGSNEEARNAMYTLRAFESDGEVFVMNRDGTDMKQLTNDSYADNCVCWSPCGKYLMYSSASSKSHQSERLKIIDADSGKRIPFDYDRSALENDIGATQQLNKTFLQLLLPDVIERRCTDPSFWGEERHPHWISR